MKPWLRALRAVACGLAWVLAGAVVAQPVQATDDNGHLVQLKAPAQRVVALGPNLVELVFAVGAGERLVGVQRYSDFPAAALRLPIVGDALALNLEAIARLKPDLLLVWGSGVNARQQQRLAALGVPVFVSEITQVAHIADTLRRLGTLLAHRATAEATALQVQADWATLQQRFQGRRPVRVFYQLWHEPLMTVSRHHLIHEAITACGGVNVFADQAPLVPTVGWEAAVQANPEVVLTGSSRDEPARLQAWQRFPQVDAVRKQHLLVLDGPALSRMSPRFVAAAARLCEAIDTARH
ncbi:ABC-type Fe3+-hydroxamate transport system, periplasmic component [Burkholderiales bacterium JOSHI_001]|nr:ABC-type Fe3+-hydroxamate transport system, periplasmic component [Burkholderiales bacterium JOSHI_001]